MLEKYSKNKAFMFIQKRAQRNRLPRRKKTDSEAPIPEEYAYDEEEDGGAYADDAPSYKEHAFKFTAFEKVCDLLETPLISSAWPKKE